MVEEGKKLKRKNERRKSRKRGKQLQRKKDCREKKKQNAKNRRRKKEFAVSKAKLNRKNGKEML